MHVTALLFDVLPSSLSAELLDAMTDEESESREGAAMTQDQFSLLMGAFSASQTRMEERFAEFRAEIRLGQEDAAAKALKRARYEKPYEYKRKGNQEQAAFNAKVDEAVAEAELLIEEAGPSTAPALERAKEALKKKASSVQSSRSRSLSVRVPAAAAREPAPPYHVPSSSTRRFASMMAPTPVRRVVGPCYACGEMGHMRMSCPRVAAPDRSRKWYPLLIGDIVHESGVDGRPPERSVCDVDDVCENLSGDVAPRREFLTGDVEYEELSRMWEIELSPPSCSIKGRLCKHLSFWRAELNASSTVLNTIESGYVLPLKSVPPRESGVCIAK